MKVAIGLLVGALFAIYLNLSPVMPRSAMFFSGITDEETNEVIRPYYAIPKQEIEWKYWHGVYFDAATQTEDGCDATPINVGADSSQSPKFYRNDRHSYWIQAIKPDTIPDDATELVFTEGEKLIVPATMKINISPSSVAAADTLVLKHDTGYTLTFSNLKCWYCCSVHEPDSDGTYRHKGSNKPKMGDELPGCSLAGIASEDTTVTFRDSSGAEVTISDFYSGLEGLPVGE
jgi:hypothetical protein